MKQNFLSVLAITFLITFLGITAQSGDFGLDPTFAPTFTFPDGDVDFSISDIYVQTDQKVMVGGTFNAVNGENVSYLVRLHPDGSRDTSFNALLTPWSNGQVRSIRPLPDGKYLISGQFKIGFEYTSYLKLNADGSSAGSLQYYYNPGAVFEPMPDGRIMVCGGRAINNETYWTAHRLNADGSPDPSFRITSATGSCTDIELQADGKVIIAATFQNPNNSYQERVQRFNADGSRDMSFSGHNFDSIARKIKLLPDGKVMVGYDVSGPQVTTSRVFRLNSNGSLDREFETCGVNSSANNAYLPLSDGSVMMSGCRKWSTGPVYQFSKTLADGTIEPSLDNISFGGSVKEIEDAGNGKYYVYGVFSQVNGVLRARLARLQPYSAPIKAKYDFDGDGRSDISIFRPSDRYWYVNQSTAGGLYIPWGTSTDKPFASNYDNDGKTDPGVFRNGVWYTLTSATGYSYEYFVMGAAQDKPMSGDFDGDKKQDWAARQVQGGSVSWLLTLNAQRGFQYSTESIPGETSTDVPVTGDFDGDGRDEIGYFRDGDWTLRDYGSGAPARTFHWGAAGDIPTPGDYDADGIGDFAVFRPSTGVWWVNRSTDGFYAVKFGLSGDIPVQADYDGDGKTDIAIFRDGVWWQILSLNNSVVAQPWGIAGDLPIPAQ